MATIKQIKTNDGVMHDIGAKYDVDGNVISETYAYKGETFDEFLPLSGGVVTGQTTFTDKVVIGEAVISFNPTTRELVFSI